MLRYLEVLKLTSVSPPRIQTIHVAMGGWGLGVALPLVGQVLDSPHLFPILPLTPLLQLTSYFLLSVVSAQRPPPSK